MKLSFNIRARLTSKMYPWWLEKVFRIVAMLWIVVAIVFGIMFVAFCMALKLWQAGSCLVFCWVWMAAGVLLATVVDNMMFKSKEKK